MNQGDMNSGQDSEDGALGVGLGSDSRSVVAREFPSARAYRIADALDSAIGATGEDYAEASYLRCSFKRDSRPGGPIGCAADDFGAASRYLDCAQVRLDRATRYANVQPVDFDVEAFIDGYVECALWADCTPADRCTHCGELLDYATVPGIEGWMHAETTSIGPRDHPAKRDENAESGGCDGLELRPGVRNKMAVDCLDFCAAEIEDLLAYCAAFTYRPLNAGAAGHDFWLTRSGHGAGYWDRGLDELGDRLSAAASAYGTPDDHTPYDCGDGTADV